MDVAGSAVGIASLGIQVCQGLLSYYNEWKDYKADIRSVYDAITDLSRTLTLLKTSLDDDLLDEERTERVKSCLTSCEDALVELSKRRQELQKYAQAEGLRQRTWSEVQKLGYPFKKDTLGKLQETVMQIQERLKLALQILDLDVGTKSQRILVNVEERVVLASEQNQRLIAVQQSDRFRKIADWLGPPDPWTNHQSARKRCELGTGSWLLQSDEYQKWKVDRLRHFQPADDNRISALIAKYMHILLLV
nr:hypothetical protein CFP56_03335 [Quercus suber]